MKNKVRLTESQLHQVIAESVHSILMQEGYEEQPEQGNMSQGTKMIQWAIQRLKVIVNSNYDVQNGGGTYKMKADISNVINALAGQLQYMK